MKSFKAHTHKEHTYKDILIENIGIVGDTLVFDYNSFSNNKEEISTKLGKKVKGVKFVPYETTSETISKHKVFSVYSIKGSNSTKIVKSLKRQSNIDVSSEDYKNFINRTAIFINSRIINKKGINYIITPLSTSVILDDILNSISYRNPYIKIISNSFKKTSPDKIKINKDHTKITKSVIDYLEKIIAKSKKDGYFAMKDVKRVQMRKFIDNIFELTPDVSLKGIEDKNVMVLDDIITSRNSIESMIKNLGLYAPNSVIPVTLFKKG